MQDINNFNSHLPDTLGEWLRYFKEGLSRLERDVDTLDSENKEQQEAIIKMQHNLEYLKDSYSGISKLELDNRSKVLDLDKRLTYLESTNKILLGFLIVFMPAALPTLLEIIYKVVSGSK